MKKNISLLLIFTIVLLGQPIYAQSGRTGTVKYHRIDNFQIEQGGEWAEFKKTLPKSRTTNYILYFSEEAYNFVENSKENEAMSDLTRKALWFAGKWGTPQVKLMSYFHNPQEKKQIRLTEFMTRLFREEAEMPKIKWKMGSATKEILGYHCMQAETVINDQKILAWFTTHIPVPAGPERYCGLPGLMLEVNINQGQTVWLANFIDLNDPGADLLAEPTEGKKVTAQRYQQIQDQKIKEWEAQQKARKSDKAVDIKR